METVGREELGLCAGWRRRGAWCQLGNSLAAAAPATYCVNDKLQEAGGQEVQGAHCLNNNKKN